MGSRVIQVPNNVSSQPGCADDLRCGETRGGGKDMAGGAVGGDDACTGSRLLRKVRDGIPV